jgi:hypothetical protein
METKEIINKLDGFCELVGKQNVEMHKALVEAVKSVGGSIETTNEDCDNLYAIIFDEGKQTYCECYVDEVKVEGDELLIRTNDIYQEDEEDEWYSVMGGMVLINATLYALCEVIPEYLDLEDN